MWATNIVYLDIWGSGLASSTKWLNIDWRESEGQTVRGKGSVEEAGLQPSTNPP